MGKLVHKRKDYTGVSPYEFVPVTEAEYNALTPAEQEDETKMYWLYDVDTVSADIDDESVSSGKVWSSEKVSSEISDVQDQVDTNTDDISTLNSAIAKQGDYQSILKTQNAGTHTSLPDLSQFNYIIVAIRDGDILINPAIIPYKMFKAGVSVQSYIYSTTTNVRRYVRATYVSDTSVTLQMEDINGNGYAALIAFN